jgi:hypothetical protein
MFTFRILWARYISISFVRRLYRRNSGYVKQRLISDSEKEKGIEVFTAVWVHLQNTRHNAKDQSAEKYICTLVDRKALYKIM